MNEQRRTIVIGIPVATGLAACGGSDTKQAATATADPVTPDNYIDRRTSFASGGTPGWVTACRWVTTEVGPDVTHFEWNLVGVLHNRANQGENCAAYFQGNAYGRGSTWGAVSEVGDRSNGLNPNVVGHEVDVWAPGPAGRDNRIGLHIVMGPPPPEFRNGQTIFEGDEALRIGTNGTPGARWRKGIRLTDAVTEVALDLSAVAPLHFAHLRGDSMIEAAAGRQVGKIPIRVGGRTLFLAVHE